jgi:hypothetical protein
MEHINNIYLFIHLFTSPLIFNAVGKIINRHMGQRLVNTELGKMCGDTANGTWKAWAKSRLLPTTKRNKTARNVLK